MLVNTREIDVGGRRTTVIEVPVGQWPPDTGSLSELELAAAAALRRSTDRVRYLTAHVALRDALGEATGALPGAIRFARAPCHRCGSAHGKPVLAGPGPAFSLSYAHERVMIALGDAAVGIDVEHVGAVSDAMAMADLVDSLHPDERTALAELPADDRRRGLLACWVRKEAYLKGTGEGIGGALDQVLVGVRTPVHPAGWRIVDLPAGRGYQAALAVRLRD